MYEITIIEKDLTGKITLEWGFWGKTDEPDSLAMDMIETIREEGRDYSYRIEKV